MDDKVSVIIPTRDRFHLLTRAVQSVINQTHRNIEILIVIDGISNKASIKLPDISDERIRIFQLETPQGGANARNIGVSAATGEFVAFLDDDDLWLPSKLAAQLCVASKSRLKFPIVGCKIIARSPLGDYIWPRRFPLEGENFQEYLLARNSLFQGEGLIQTSMIFTTRKLAQLVSFDPHLKKHQEWDWIIRALQVPGAGVVYADNEPLAIWHIEEDRHSISAENDWKFSFEWASSRQSILSPRAYIGFVVTIVVAAARKQNDWSAFVKLFIILLKSKSTRFIDFFLFFSLWFVPVSTRRRMRSLLKLQNQTKNLL